jgi:hypothetical protein
MSNRTTFTTWESLRPSDGSPLVISFDWYEDHSAWRLEELDDSITAALTLLTGADIEVSRPERLYELTGLVEQLRTLHRSNDTSDAAVRRALELADELDLGSDIESFDAQYAYDSDIEYLHEVLDSWDDHNRWRWTDDEYYVYAEKHLERILKSRHGLGERWSVTVFPDRVEFPDGIVVYGHNPDKEQGRLMDLVYGHIDREDDLALVAGPMAALDERSVRRSLVLVEALVAVNDDLDARTVQTVMNTAASTTIADEDLDRIADTVTALAPEWLQQFDELIVAATTLNGSGR